MSLSTRKLYCGNRTTNTITDTVNLYTSLADVQNQGKMFKFNNEVLYAKYGDINDSKASKIRVKINGVAKALLRSAYVTKSKIDDFTGYVDNLQFEYQYGTQGGAFGSDGRESSSSYRQYSIESQKLPLDATNLKVEFLITSIEDEAYISLYYLEKGSSQRQYVGSYNTKGNKIVVNLPNQVVSSFGISAGKVRNDSEFAYSQLSYIKLYYDTNQV